MILARTLRAAATALACAVVTAPVTAVAALSAADIQFWTGASPGPGVSEAVLVIDFGHPGAPATAPSLAWGYRWPSSQARHGLDMLTAVIGADPRLSATGLEFGFVDTIRFDADLNGTPDFGHPGFDPVSGRYSMYWVNNAVVTGTPPLFADAGHVLPPNGNPYASESPGTWIVSSTGLAARPLADGSWDGWVFASDGQPGPREPVPATVVPEPGTALLALAALAVPLASRRRSRSSGAPGHGARHEP